MNRISNIIVIFILFTVSGFSQGTIRFSQQYDFFDTNAGTSGYLSTNVFRLGNDYVVTGIVTTPTINGGLGIVRTDSVGVIKYQKQIRSISNYRFTNNTANQMFMQLQNKDLLFTGQYELGIDYSKACMARVSHLTGDTLWTRMYSQPGDSTYLLCSTELSDSSIIGFGFRYYLNTVANVNYTKPFMLKVDKHGNYKWHKYINGIWTNSIFFMYQKVIRLNDNDFVVVGGKQSPSNNGFMMRIDTNAVKQYEVNINVNGINNTGLGDCIILQDGTYLACGVYYWPNGKVQKLVYQFNGLTGAKLQHRLYNTPANIGGLTTVVQKPNGIILGGGGTGYTVPVNTYDSQGDVLKLTSNLDSITTIKLGATNPADQMAPSQLILTSDGGFAVNIGSYPASSQQKFWLIKADSNGCYSSSCSTIGIEERVLTDGNWDVYPNPSTGVVYMRLPQAGQTGVAEIRDVNGKWLAERIVNGEEHIELPTENLSAGVYMVRFIQAGVAVETRKLVLTR